MSYPITNREAGFTAVEMLAAIAVSGLVFAALTATFTTQSRSSEAEQQISEMQQNVRTAMDLLTREIRMAGYNPAGAGVNGITYSSSQIQIQADLNGDGDVLDANENIIYSHDAANLWLNRDSGGWQTVAENIEGFTFTYLDTNGNSTTTPANIRQIRISITGRTAKPDPNYRLNGGYRTYTLTSMITPRNLAY